MSELNTTQVIKDFSNTVNKTLVPRFRNCVDSMKNLSTDRFTCDKELESCGRCNEQCQYCGRYNNI